MTKNYGVRAYSTHGDFLRTHLIGFLACLSNPAYYAGTEEAS